jgi:Predicted membrane protein (DUF2142)
MSKRGGTRSSPPARTKAPANKRQDAAAANGDGRAQASGKRVGSRAFDRRARAVDRTRVVGQQRPALSHGPSQLPARLLSFSPGALLARVPRAALICALVACLNAICWSIVTPPFEVTDEPDHFAYVKQLADKGSLPTSQSEETAEEELAALIALRYYKVRQQPQNHTISSSAEQGELERSLAAGPHDSGSAAVGDAASQPPLYYALEAIPYSLAKNGTVLDRLQLMRLMSALFAGLTALFAYLFLREALPASRWAWTVGGLCVALAPLLGFMSGAVNPDSMLAAVSAGVFYLLARAFRRGLSMRGAVALGALTAIGLVTKLNFDGLLPGVLLGLVVLAARAASTSGRAAALRMLGVAVAVAFSPLLPYVLVNVLANHPALGVFSGGPLDVVTVHGNLLAQLDYVWQLYLPRLPGTVNDFPGLFTTRQLWFDNYVGLYGFLDTTFPGWVDDLALVPAGAIALLCARSLLQARGALRGRAWELAVYAVMCVGLLALVGTASFKQFPSIDAEYAQPRYLLPLFALVGAVVALAARGAGRRWGPAVGALLVVLFLAHDVLSQMLVAGRFYV